MLMISDNKQKLFYELSINGIYLRPSYVCASSTEGESILIYKYFQDKNNNCYENSESMHTL